MSKSIPLFLAFVAMLAVFACVGDHGATPSSTSTPTSEPTPTLAPTPTIMPTTKPTAEALNYFLEIALGLEFGDSSVVIRKWSRDLLIRVHGNPTTDDLGTLAQVISELNELAGGLKLELVQGNANVDIHFAPESKFPLILPSYVPGNTGFFWVWWRDSDIYRAMVLISSDQENPQEVRSHLIREELTQTLGLMRDSHSYPESIFYQKWTTVTEYAGIDREIIRILYFDDVVAGMTRDDVLALFDGY